MHAVVVNIQIDPERSAEAHEGLIADVIPSTKKAPGFIKAIWTGDHHAGGPAVGLVMFDSEKNARAMADQVSAPADAPVRIVDVAVYPVAGEA